MKTFYQKDKDMQQELRFDLFFSKLTFKDLS